jgi:hypothetical protein
MHKQVHFQDILLLILGLLLVASPSQVAATGDTTLSGAEVMKRMKKTIEPPRPSLRTVEFVLKDPEGSEVRWLAREVRKHCAEGSRVLLAFLEPSELKGSALLIAERPDKPDAQWVYSTPLRRVRKIFPVGGLQPFLLTDFTYADLGFISLQDRTFELQGTEVRNGRSLYKVEEFPNQKWYYWKIVNWIDAETLLPVQRDYFSPSRELWKSLFFENVTVVQGVPTPLRVRMEDLREGGSSELRVTKIRYDEEIPEDVFDPKRLPSIMSQPIWSAAQEPNTNGE